MTPRIIFLSTLFTLITISCAPIALQTSQPTSTLTQPTAIPAPLPSPTLMRDQNLGTLSGRVTIGPLRPGPVRVDETPPSVPPEVYAARTIQIFTADGVTLVTNVKINPDGTYSVTLPSGNYVVNLARTGIDRARGLPKTITLERGKPIQLDIDIDTGIR